MDRKPVRCPLRLSLVPQFGLGFGGPLGALGRPLALLALGPLALSIIVLTLFPETAGVELETLNPEDAGDEPG